MCGGRRCQEGVAETEGQIVEASDGGSWLHVSVFGSWVRLGGLGL